MPSKKPYIQIRTTNEIIEKFKIIADKENRSSSNLGETIIKNYITTYEAEHGEIVLPEQETD